MVRPPILISYDSSPAAARAVEMAGALFPGRPALVLYVWPGVDTARVHTAPVEPVREELIAEVRRAARRDAEAVAAEGATRAMRVGLEANPLTIESSDGIADTIVWVAAKESVAAVVVGRGSRARLPRRHGRLARSLIDHSSQAVVVV